MDLTVWRRAPGFLRRGERITILVSATSCHALRDAFLDWSVLRERFVEAVITWPDVSKQVLFLDDKRFQARSDHPAGYSAHPLFVRQDKEGIDWVSGVGDDARATLLLVRSAA